MRGGGIGGAVAVMEAGDDVNAGNAGWDGGGGGLNTELWADARHGLRRLELRQQQMGGPGACSGDD